ncbi:di-trans,poly-cis-decaprenylcistransferase [Candidatus Micrarchaeota archaeon]|nr:di-trans,poly-cis-decaprenylcistransferase [Candidatus Micrarchaeota archaeon]
MRKLNHLAIIPDGNRRFAKKSSINLTNGYQNGFKKVEEVLNWSKDEGIKRTTFWALSLDNFTKRSSIELKAIYYLLEKNLSRSLAENTLVENDTKMVFFGKTELLPKKIQGLMNDIQEKTADCSSQEISVAIAYNGQEEIASAAARLAQDYKEGKISKIDESSFSNYLYYNHSPDLVIRTGDSPRLSGLMPWQTVYSELYFSKKLWPEFDKNEFDAAIDFYNSIESKKGR